MFTCLVCRSLCIDATQLEAIELAHRHGFDSVEARADELARLTEGELERLLDDLRAKGLRFGLAGLPIDLRRDAQLFADGMRQLPEFAQVLQHCGVTRLGSSIVPFHDELSYAENFQQHVERFGEVARVLGDHGIRFGLEYCATPTLRRGKPHEFIHSLPQLRELIAAISTRNLGLVLDSWHWWMSGSPATELASLQRDEIVSVDLNDAPLGSPKVELLDRQRELPGATGVIDLTQFFGALTRLGYDGPVRAEPFEFSGWRSGRKSVCQQAGKSLRLVLGTGQGASH
ncbi:MAG: sugar phosphate isomerase/epimerase [Verrucomicrobia bacterium]|nr:sugar phosphate isomerase/epimerase [Verrucomicrobiota bacterium]